MGRKSVAIAWDINFNVYTLKAEKKDADKITILKKAAFTSAENAFAEKLSRAYHTMNAKKCDAVILGGPIPGSACVEMIMPKLPSQELVKALEYEFTRQLPYSTEDLRLFFRNINRLDKNATNSRVRVLSIQAKDWENLLGDITASGIKLDTVTHPFMAADPVLTGQSLCLNDVEPDYCFIPTANQEMREVTTSNNKTENDPVAELTEPKLSEPEYRTATVLAAYSFTPEFRADQKTLCNLPGMVIPQRYRILKRCALLLSILLAVALVTAGVRAWSGDMHRINQIKAENARATKLLESIKNKTLNKRELAKVVRQINGSLEDKADILYTLSHLSQLIPTDMWVTNMNCNGSSITMTIMAGEDNSNLASILNNSNYFVVKNLRKMRRRMGPVTIRVTLEPVAGGKK